MLKAGTHSRLVPGAKSGLVLRLPKAGPAMLRFFCRRYDLIRSIGRLIYGVGLWSLWSHASKFATAKMSQLS